MNSTIRAAIALGACLIGINGTAVAQDRAASPARARQLPPSSPPTRPRAPLGLEARRAIGESRAQKPSPAPALFTTASNDDRALPLEAAEDAIDKRLVGFGSWLDDSTYGRVWQPAPECVGAGFVPYASAGRWSMDDGKLRWKSAAPWGDTTFHQGNWVWLHERGWVWAPPTPTSPPALAWRLGGNHVGWAPVPPARLATSPQPPSGESTLPFRFVKVGDLLDEDISRRLVTDLGEGRALLAAAPRLDGAPEAKSLLTAATAAPVAATAPVTRTTTATSETRRLAPTPSRIGSRYQCKQVTETPRTWRCAWE